MTCTQEVTAIVSAPRPNWDSIVWTLINQVGGLATHAFNNAAFNVAASGRAGIIITDPGIRNADLWHGVLTYNGPASNALLQMTFSGQKQGSNVGDTNMDCNVSMTGVGILVDESTSEGFTVGTDGSGVYNRPFVIPDTGGVPQVITVVLLWGAGISRAFGVSGNVSMTGSGSITNS